ncbi:L-lactate permease [Rhizohabitans arisaemae]|uniref:L-lactate permease n=1 Tax=Rhizohabitans arisaemae TaxID=2720610 RepID=UPI0024B0C1B8|nr:L-lactate permease [Rhizohabitans arisaemae]
MSASELIDGLPPIDLGHWAAAVAPIAVLLGLVLWGRWSTAVNGLITLGTAVGIAALLFGAGPQVLLVGVGKGLWVGVWILCVVLSALFLHHCTTRMGLDRPGGLLRRILPYDVENVLVIAWVFASLVQGVAGFGVPIAVAAPLLVAMGIKPVLAVAMPLVGYHWSVGFGSMGSSFYMGSLTAGLDAGQTARYAVESSLLLGVNALIAGILVAFLHSGWRGIVRAWRVLLVCGPLMAGAQALAVRAEPAIGALAAGVAGIAGVALLRWLGRARRSRDRVAISPGPVRQGTPPTTAGQTPVVGPGALHQDGRRDALLRVEETAGAGSPGSASSARMDSGPRSAGSVEALASEPGGGGPVAGKAGTGESDAEPGAAVWSGAGSPQARMDGSIAARGRKPREAHPALAFVPYGLLFLLALAVYVPGPSRDWVKTHLLVGPSFPTTQTAYGLVNEPVQTYTPIALLGHPAFYVLVAAAGGLLVWRLLGHWPKGGLRTTTAAWAGQAKKSVTSILALTAVANLMTDTGMIRMVAVGTAEVLGGAYPLVAPLVGLIGAFLTGSTTSSNTLFASFQRDVADQLALPPSTLLAAQLAGGNIGNSLAPVTTAIGALSLGDRTLTAPALRRTLTLSWLLLTATIALTFALLHVF